MEDERTVAEEMTFGAAIEELEGIVRRLEGGHLELEESLAQYERGVALLAHCQKKLGAARQRVTMLLGQIEADDAAQTPENDAPGGEAQ